MRKSTTSAPRATKPAAAGGATAGKKQRKQADSVHALTALLAQTRTAQRRLLILVGRLRSAEQAIVAALDGATPARPEPTAPGPPRPRPRAAGAGSRRPRKPV